MTKPKPKLTLEGLKAAMTPPNNCRVKAFRDALDADSQEVLDTALGLDKREFPASAVVRFLSSAGFADEDIPGESAIQDHRNGRRPCHCRG